MPSNNIFGEPASYTSTEDYQNDAIFSRT